MAVVFARELDRLDLEDTRGSLSKLENHIRYMQEQVDFSVRGIARTVNAGTSSAALYEQVQEAAGRVSALDSQVQAIAGDAAALRADLSALEARVAALEAGAAGT